MREVGFYLDQEKRRFYALRDADFTNAAVIPLDKAQAMLTYNDWTFQELAQRLIELQDAFPGSFKQEDLK